MRARSPLPPSHWPTALAHGAALAAGYAPRLRADAIAVVYGRAGEQTVHGFTGPEELACAHLHAALARFHPEDVIGAWVVEPGERILRHQGIGRPAELLTQIRGWNPEIGPLVYQLAHEAWSATAEHIACPRMTLSRAGARSSWEIDFVQRFTELDGDVVSTIELHTYAGSFGAFADLPPAFWAAARRTATLAELIAVLDRYGARDLTRRTRPPQYLPLTEEHVSETARAREHLRFWTVLADATAPEPSAGPER